MRDTHIVLTLGRSGSNTLVDMLNQHPNLLNYGEVLGDWMPVRRWQRRFGLYRDDDRAYLDALLDRPAWLGAANAVRSAGKLARFRPREAKRLRDIRTVGFKEFSLNLERAGLSDYARHRAEARIIGLTRRNVIERAVSFLLLQSTGVVAAREGAAASASPTAARPRIDPDAALRLLAVVEAENAALERMLGAHDPARVFRLDYADLYRSPRDAAELVRRIYAFLDLPDRTPQVRMRKIAPRDPLDALENGAELRAHVAASRFAPWLFPGADGSGASAPGDP